MKERYHIDRTVEVSSSISIGIVGIWLSSDGSLLSRESQWYEIL